jgi:hypothetical protein
MNQSNIDSRNASDAAKSLGESHCRVVTKSQRKIGECDAVEKDAGVVEYVRRTMLA